MCGLVAVFHPDRVTPPPVEELSHGLETSLEIIKHRGPDSRGIYISPDARVGLGHVRLSIIDLPTGQQPLSDEDQLIHCVVTGEIYDHERIRAELEGEGFSFKSKSDSELVLQLYKRDGINFLYNLRGEFAFVLFDVERRLFFVARDRFGIKPMYYTVSNGRIMFASEIKAFMGLGWKAEWDIESIVQHGEYCDDRTVFKDVKKVVSRFYARNTPEQPQLLAGNFMMCRSSGHINIQTYWDLSYPAATAQPTSTIETMVSTVREHLVEAVRLRLRSDVPLAVYLSGGLDSSAVAGIATHLLREKDPNSKLTTFTLAYPSDGQDNNEGPFAARTAAYLGADIHMVNVDEAALVGAMEDSIWHTEQVSNTFHGAGKNLLSKYTRSKGFKVVLSGEGSDEIFGGYSWFQPDYFRDSDPAASGLGVSLPSDADRHAILKQLEKMSTSSQVAALTQTNNDTSPGLLRTSSHRGLAGILSLPAEVFHPKVWKICGAPDVARSFAEAAAPRVRENSVSGRWHSLNIAMYMTTKTLMGQLILNMSGDRNDMAHAIESRVPFLDHHLVEYVNTLPPSVKMMPVAGGEPGTWTLTEKWILREAARPFITDEIYLRKKVMYNPPPATGPGTASRLLPLQEHLKRRITQTTVERVGFFDWQNIKEMLDGYLESPAFPAHGAIDSRARKLMCVLSFIVLQERFNVPTLEL
ncbi:putative asparagine synthase [Mycena maculata]|uniref:Asparagine synthase n=1 Tax=Mycena maculata TaxID=230809 RepID=A0AAD7HZ22_9AGAR|nr:putative asparagine synthase [Mycena maculata]